MQCAEGVKKNCTQKHRRDIIKETKKNGHLKLDGFCAVGTHRQMDKSIHTY